MKCLICGKNIDEKEKRIGKMIFPSNQAHRNHMVGQLKFYLETLKKSMKEIECIVNSLEVEK